MLTLLKNTILRESITHIEDLSLNEFIRTVESMKDKIVTEKLDGANLWFGLDDTGIFTSREGKSPKKGRFYNVSDYPVVANYNAFRAAHLAIEKAEPIIRKYLKSGDTVEIEVLYGRQPNTVTYGVEGKNFIVILRGVNSTPEERVNNLSKALNNHKFNIESVVVDSPDGTELELNDEKMVWEFTNVAPITASKINTKEATALLANMKKFIAEKNKVFPDLTNAQVAEISLTSVPKEQRAEAKQERERINAQIMNDYKSPIKEHLLNHFVRKIKPMLQAGELHPSEDIGVEGVVVRDPVTGSMTKIVDKDVFTAINSFNSAVRAEVSGLVRTTDSESTIEMRGGAFGEAKIKIAELMGDKALAMSTGTKRYVSKFKGQSPSSTAVAVANNLNITSVSILRTKISTILRNTVKEVDDILHKFKNESGEFKLQLKTGKEIGISPEVMKRTLTSFAETKKDIAEIDARILQSRTGADLVMALYGRQIESLFDGDNAVKESFNLIRSINEDDAPSADTISSDSIAPFAFKIGNGRKITMRKRNFTKPKKFPIIKDDSDKLTLLQTIQNNTVKEDWAHVKDMKFATDVGNSATSQADVEFNQMRNNVNIGNDDLTQMDVNRYLDKAHELNNEVESVTFGLELDNGQIVKVYVNAGQADQFEKALADSLGNNNDVEEVINDLANRFDIVDVEWPQSMSEPQVEPQEEPEENSLINLDLHDENGNVLEPDQSEQSTEEPEQSTEEPEQSDQSSEEEPDQSEQSSEEERDEFGQIIKKKKKKEETTEESLKYISRMLVEAARLQEDGQVMSYANPALQAVNDMMIAMGFDQTKTQSFDYQAKQLQSRNSPGIMVAKNTAVLSKIKMARDTLVKAIELATTQVKPGMAPTTNPAQAQESVSKYSLLGAIAEEDEREEGKWSFANLGSLGFKLTTRGFQITLDHDEAEKVHLALADGKSVSVHFKTKRYEFKPSNSGYMVYQIDEKGNQRGQQMVMPAEEVETLITELEGK